MSKPIHPQARLGHVHLKAADLERSLGFYRDVLGFEVTMRLGDSAAFLSAGGYHHHLGLNTWESLGGSEPVPGTTGLYHLAILYRTRAELADALRRSGRSLRPRREPRTLPARPRRQRRGAVLRLPPGRVAAHRRRRTGSVRLPLGPAGPACLGCLRAAFRFVPDRNLHLSYDSPPAT